MPRLASAALGQPQAASLSEGAVSPTGCHCWQEAIHLSAPTAGEAGAFIRQRGCPAARGCAHAAASAASPLDTSITSAASQQSCTAAAARHPCSRCSGGQKGISAPKRFLGIQSPADGQLLSPSSSPSPRALLAPAKPCRRAAEACPLRGSPGAQPRRTWAVLAAAAAAMSCRRSRRSGCGPGPAAARGRP